MVEQNEGDRTAEDYRNDPRYRKLCREIISEIEKRGIKDQNRLNRLKAEMIRKQKIENRGHPVEFPTNIDLALAATASQRQRYKDLLTIKPVRTLSGVTVVAIMTKPSRCPHGKCIMCPGGVNSEFGDVPQSYTGKEPATRRAIRNLYDPYLQVFNRLEQYVSMNKVPDKIELIIMGGTFLSLPKKYQEDFVKYSLKAMNDFGRMFFSGDKLLFDKFADFFELPSDIGSDERSRRLNAKSLKMKTFGEEKRRKTLSEVQKENETAKIRCVGLTIETRADYAKLAQANEMLRLGCTRVELGVQSVYDDVLKEIERGYSSKDNIEAIAVLKDLGFKINVHYMPGLPGVSHDKDLAGMIDLFADPSYRPDMIKIYPCMVVKGTKLYDRWNKGKFKPLTTQKASELIAEFKQHVPPYCRVMRVQRDIPSDMVSAGVDRTNLRQYIASEMRNKGIVCKCIRCREIGQHKGTVGKPNVRILHYTASGGTEFFITVEYEGFIMGFLRLRFLRKALRKEMTSDSAIVRELHVYGEAVELGKKGRVQHSGFGKRLLRIAESIAKQYNRDKMIIISGIGVREYYRMRGYRQEGPYMVKAL